MDKDSIIKLRAWALFSFAILIYPAILVFTILWEILTNIFRNTKCKNISGDVALVTGGGHGLGRCIAIELAKMGCDVAIADINLEGAEETAKMVIEQYNTKAKAYKVDVSSYDDVNDLNLKIMNDLGAATILINNAGILVLSNFLKPNWEETQRIINVNLAAHFWTNQIFLPNMKLKKKGHIVAIASLAGMFPLAFSSHYTSTKYAVRGMMRSLRLELKANRQVHGEEIYATTVCPNFLQTNDKVVNIVRKTGVDALYPLMTGEETAKRIITGMLRNEEEIIIPGIMGLMYRFYETLPAHFQDLLLFIQAYITIKRLEKIHN